MGYCMEMKGSKFFVLAEHTGLIFAMTKGQPYDFQLDSDGNISELEFTGEKLGSDFELFQSIAPYVQDGSQWRWVFQSGACREVKAKVEWPDE